MKLQGPENTTGLSYGDQSFTPDADGCIEIPDELATTAFSHGFTLPVDESSQPVVKNGKKNGKKATPPEGEPDSAA